MKRRFDPAIFSERVILMDTSVQPPAEAMNCLGCGKLASELYKYDQLCGPCYAKWERAFREQWKHARFG
jgi:hypothetical protein